MSRKSFLSRMNPGSWPIFGGDGMAAIIARRLLGVVLLFALLDICLVLTTYVQDQEGLGQRLLSLQAEEIGEAIIVEDSHARFDPALLYREPIGSARLAFAIYDQRGQEIAVRGAPRTHSGFDTAVDLGKLGNPARGSLQRLPPSRDTSPNCRGAAILGGDEYRGKRVTSVLAGDPERDDRSRGFAVNAARSAAARP